MAPLISVLMPVYNAERYLVAAVESVLAQTLANFELIAVNDGSKDNSLAILKDLAKRDARVKIISRPNTGIVGALNDGLAASSGEWIARMDSDDIALPDRFEKQLQFMKEHASVVAAGTFVQIIDEDDAPIHSPELPVTHQEIEEVHLTGDSAIYHPSVMIKRSAMMQLGGYREGTCPCEDYDLYLRLGEIGELANIPMPLLKYRRSSTSIVTTHAKKITETRERVLSDALKRRGIEREIKTREFPLSNITDFYRQWAWMALQSGHRRTARKYAIRSLFKAPMQQESWRLAFCVVRGR